MSRGVHTLLLLPHETLEEAFDQPSRWVDHFPSISAAEIGMLLDYLASEFNINLPSTIQGNVPFGFSLLAALNRYDATSLRTRLKKKVRDLSLKAILQSYGHAGDGGTEWSKYLSRQSQYCQTDDCLLVLLVSSAADISEELNTRQ